jgi:hypothetical protein
MPKRRIGIFAMPYSPAFATIYRNWLGWSVNQPTLIRLAARLFPGGFRSGNAMHGPASHDMQA